MFNISDSASAPRNPEYVWVANHPYGGVARVRQCRDILHRLISQRLLEAVLCEKLGALDDSVFADVVLNVILRDSGIHIVIPAMMRVEHIRANVKAVANSRFDSHEIARIRKALAHTAESGQV